jgi:hypothetical protein
MSEQPVKSGESNVRFDEVTLEELGQLCREAIPDPAELERVMALSDNPNVYSDSGLIFNTGEIPTKPDKAYRQVGREALEHLAQTGIVMNGATAKGETHKRWGHRVFWHAGVDGKAMNAGGRAVLVAPLEVAQKGWVTARDLEAIYAPTNEGIINILDKQEQAESNGS